MRTLRIVAAVMSILWHAVGLYDVFVVPDSGMGARMLQTQGVTEVLVGVAWVVVFVLLTGREDR